MNRSSIAAKINIIAASLAVLFLLLAAITQGLTMRNVTLLGGVSGAYSQLNDTILPLQHAAKEMDLDITQVQQFFSDISATRAQDGLDDGLKEAEENAKEFRRDVVEARRYADALGDREIRATLDKIAGDFEPYYLDGQRMAQAYIEAGPAGGNPLNPSPQNAATPPEVPWLWSGVAAAMAILAGISLWGWLRPTPPEPRSVVRISTNLPVTAGNGTFALSRDGSRLAYVSGPHRQIYVRMMDQLDAKALPGTEAASFLCFSPDGQWISFVTQPPALKLEKIALAGGPPQVIADFGGSSVAPVHSWGPDNNILIAVSGALLRIPASGGQAQTLATPDPKTNEVGFAGAQLLPGGKEILVRIARLGSADIAALNIESGKRKILVERASVSLLRFLPTGPGASAGHIVYSAPSIGSLMAVPFDASRVEVKGSPVPVVDGLQGLNSGPLWAVSDSGTLVYVAGSPRAVTALVWVDRKGVEQPVPAPARNYFTLSLSPDGQRVALVAPGEKTEMWVYDIARGTSLKIASSRDGGLPVWTPDGKRIIYRQIPNEIAWAPADNSGPPTLLANMEKGGAPTPTSVSPDGKMLAGFYGTGEVLWVLPLTEGSTGDSKPQSLVDSQPGKRDPHFSPDGQWVAYRTSETGVNEVYVAPYPGPGAKFPISPGGGAQPRWSHDGRELFYRTQDPSQVLAVDIQTTPSFRAGTPKVLFEEHGSYAQFYDVSPDGKRFLMVKRPDSAQPSAIQATVVLNWFEELRLRAPVGK